MGNRHENEPGDLHDLDRGHRALTYAASVIAPSLSQAFPLVGCVMVHLLPLLLVFEQCESLAAMLLIQFGCAYLILCCQAACFFK